MCGEKDIKCEVKVVELKNGYQIQVTGEDVKDILSKKNLKKCVDACCSGNALFKDICGR